MSIEAPAPTPTRTTEEEADLGDSTSQLPDIVDSPELSPDELNRQEDREILGRSVRVRHDISQAGHDAVSAGDKLFAKLQNTLGAPRKSFREWRMNRAKNRLEHKEARANAKHERATNKYDAHREKLEAKLNAKKDAEQAWVDSASSARLREKRQAKVDQKHNKRSMKVEKKLSRHKQKIDAKHAGRTARNDQYRRNFYDPSAKKYQEVVDLHQSRLDRAQGRSERRDAKIEQTRSEALRKKELAIARKELRAMLRGEENEASRRETRDILTDIFGGGDKAVGEDRLRLFAREVIARQRAEAAHGRAESDRRSQESRYASTQRLIEQASQQSQQLEGLAERDTQQSETVEASLPDLQEKYDQLLQTHGEDDLQTVAAAQELEHATGLVETLRKSAEEKAARARQYAEKALSLQGRLPAMQEAIDLARAAAETEAAQARVATEQAEATARSLLDGDNQPTPPETKPTA